MDPVAAFVAALAPGCQRGWDKCATIGFYDKSGRLEAGVVYHDWSPEYGVIELSAASLHRRWVTRQRVQQIMHYPFYQIGCRMVVARNSEYNTVTRRIWAAFGARETRIPELRSPTEDEIVHTLTKKAWEASKFVRGTHGQR